MRRILIAVPLVLLALGGCARPKANTQPVSPWLDVPPPPPRAIAAPDPEEVPDPPAVDPPETRERHPARSRPSPQARADQRAQDKQAEKKTEPVPEPPRTAAGPPAGTLQPALPAPEGQVERQVRDQLILARRYLERVDYRALNADGKAQYDTAKRFTDQAELALQEKNLVFAAKLAEKAVGLATSLLGR